MNPMELIYKVVAGRIGISLDQFREMSKGWTFTPLNIGGEMIGATMEKGAEIHVAYTSKPPASIRAHIRKTLGEVIAHNGFALTSVMYDNQKGKRFCERLGFKETSRSDRIIYMKCDRCNYA